MCCETPRILDEAIQEFLAVSHSAEDDSARCRQIIGQLLADVAALKEADAVARKGES